MVYFQVSHYFNKGRNIKSEEHVRGLYSMKAIINVRPYTAWNLLDHVIVQLGKEGDRICDNRISEDPFYNALIDLVCKEDVKELPKHVVIAKPFYPYILLTYYVLFHKGNLDLAKTLYRKLLKIYIDNPNVFDRNEEASLKIIGEVIEFLDTLRELDKNIHKDILEHHLEVLIARLNKADCVEGSGWSCLFKDLIISDLEPNLERGYEKLHSIKEMYRTGFIPIDEELIEGYNLFMTEEFSPIYTFLSSIAERELDSLKHVFEEIHKLEVEERNVKEKLNKVLGIQRMLYIYAEKAESTLKKAVTYWPLIGGLLLGFTTIPRVGLLGFVFVAIPLLTYLLKLAEILVKRNLKKIEERINYLKSSRVERLAKIIWLS